MIKKPFFAASASALEPLTEIARSVMKPVAMISRSAGVSDAADFTVEGLGDERRTCSAYALHLVTLVDP
jgi:hypothetical protein